jgi:outer membrane protein OmpA-like peptidoglycan-associated protein
MKRIFLGMVLAVALLGFIGSAFAAPAMNGSMGLFRVLDANNAGSGCFNLGLYGSYATKSKTIGTVKNDYTDIWLYPGISFAPMKFLEISASVPYVFSQKMKQDTITRWDRSGLQNAEVGLKFSYKFSPMFAAGLRAVVIAPTLADTFRSRKNASTYWDKNAPKFGGQALFSLNVMNKAKIHLNAGAMYDMQEIDTTGPASTSQKFAKLNTKLSVPYGIGVEYDGLPWVTPSVEVSGKYILYDDGDTLPPFNSNFYIRKTAGSATKTKPGPLDQGIFITPGLKADFPMSGAHHLMVALGVDVPFSSARVDRSLLADSANGKASFYDWQVIGGLAYQYIRPAGPKVPPTGSIAGLVTDTDKNPLAGAEVGFPGTTVTPVTTGADGKFAVTGLPVGMITVSGSKDLYNTKEEQATIVKNKVSDVTIVMEKKPVLKATLAGKVTDIDSKGIANTTVKIEGSTATTDASGNYSMDVVVVQAGGTYNVDVTADGYHPKSGNVALMPGQAGVKDFMLLKRGLKLRLVVNFAVARWEIVGRQDDLQRVAGIIKDNPGVNVTIAGYTSSPGAVKYNQRLSEKRAGAVRDALIANGAPADQITAVGYGETDFVATNRTAAGRALNRRIELHVP